MPLLKDIAGFLKSMSHIDILLYLAVLALIILAVSLIYIIKLSNLEEDEDSKEELNLEEVVKNIDETQENTCSYFNAYESEQEEKAIISYDELIERNKENLSTIKKTPANNGIKINKIALTKENNEGTLTHEIGSKYQEEEEFLASLKDLIKNL